MTLVVGVKGTDLIHLIADTASSIPASQTDLHPYSEPLIKVFAVGEDKGVAFAGAAHFLEHLDWSALELLSFGEVVGILLDLHRGSLRAIDFLVVDQPSWSLVKIADGRAESLDSAWIGSRPAFSAFQELRHNETTFSTRISIIPVLCHPETDDPLDCAYHRDLTAFQQVVLQGVEGVAGYALPFLVTREEVGFGSYSLVARADIQPEEIASGTDLMIGYGDPFRGGFAISVGGRAGGHMVYYQPLKTLAVHRGFLTDGHSGGVRISGVPANRIEEALRLHAGVDSWFVGIYGLAES